MKEDFDDIERTIQLFERLISVIVLISFIVSSYSVQSSAVGITDIGLKQSDIATLVPGFNSEDIVPVGRIDTVDGLWLTADGENITDFLVLATLFQYSEPPKQVLQISYQSSNSYFEIDFDYSGVSNGSYYWNIQFLKLGYETQIISRDVKLVKPDSYGLTLDYSEQLYPGQEYYIEARVREHYSEIGSIGAIDFECMFNVTLKYENGSEISFVETVETDDDGYCSITLPGSITSEVASLESIKIFVTDNDGIHFTAEESLDRYTIVMKDENPVQTILNIDMSIVIPILVILVVGGIVLLIWFIRKRIKKAHWGEISAETDY